MNLDDIYNQMNLLSHAYEESDYEIKYMHKQSDMLRERAGTNKRLHEMIDGSTVSGTIKTNLSKFHKKFILFICFLECQAPMFPFGDSCSEMSSKLNEFVIAVDERDGDMYGYGQYVAY